ncbi:hypothetical protein ANCCAN_14733 [Ancylostoma caninum]|uniref:Uncharacterized protein n=1 Tax=Ancylostoma caninum TaxID=29170 RepID=A0A368G4R0_ANCCA|nr:hypothetical protein ANCCAN_14733 [Ancylostoma caninum]
MSQDDFSSFRSHTAYLVSVYHRRRVEFLRIAFITGKIAMIYQWWKKLVDRSVTISECIPGLARLFNEPGLTFCTGLKR